MNIPKETAMNKKSFSSGVIAGLILAALSMMAQETYTVGPTTAQQVADLTDIITAANQKTCLRWSAVGAPNCTQAAACTAAGAAGGASCSPAQARAAQARIYPNVTQADRTEYVTFAYVSDGFKRDRVTLANSRQHDIAVAAWAAASQAQRNTACALPALGSQPPGCDFLTLQ